MCMNNASKKFCELEWSYLNSNLPFSGREFVPWPVFSCSFELITVMAWGDNYINHCLGMKTMWLTWRQLNVTNRWSGKNRSQLVAVDSGAFKNTNSSSKNALSSVMTKVSLFPLHINLWLYVQFSYIFLLSMIWDGDVKKPQPNIDLRHIDWNWCLA